jgi:hypothetical protein
MPKDIAGTCLFLASEESAGITGEQIDVTHGLSARRESSSTYMTRPSMRSLDGAGLNIFFVAGESWDDALESSKILVGSGARVRLGLARNADVSQARARLHSQGVGDELTVARFNRNEPDAMDPDRVAIIDAIGGSLDAATAPLQRFEHVVQPWVTYGILPAFGLFNAGVTIDAAVLGTLPTAVPLGIMVGLVLGKPLGIGLTSWLAVKTGLAELPEGSTWQRLIGSMLAAAVGIAILLTTKAAQASGP